MCIRDRCGGEPLGVARNAVTCKRTLAFSARPARWATRVRVALPRPLRPAWRPPARGALHPQ
eukprot:3016580-Alexandrium_andersonii.AAC.1